MDPKLGVSKKTEEPKEPRNRTGTEPYIRTMVRFLVPKIPNFRFGGWFGSEPSGSGTFPKEPTTLKI
jgi:hypothetical protein